MQQNQISPPKTEQEMLKYLAGQRYLIKQLLFQKSERVQAVAAIQEGGNQKK